MSSSLCQSDVKDPNTCNFSMAACKQATIRRPSSTFRDAASDMARSAATRLEMKVQKSGNYTVTNLCQAYTNAVGSRSCWFAAGRRAQGGCGGRQLQPPKTLTAAVYNHFSVLVLKLLLPAAFIIRSDT